MKMNTEEEFDTLFADYRGALRAAQAAVMGATNENELTAAHDAVVNTHQKMREASDDYLHQKVAKGELFRNGKSTREAEDEHMIMKTVKGLLPMTCARIGFGLLWDEVDSFDSIDAEKKERLEWVILNSPDGSEYAVHYANKVLKGPWLDGEECIARDPQWGYMYSSLVLQARFEIAESVIQANEVYWNKYTRKFGIANPVE